MRVWPQALHPKGAKAGPLAEHEQHEAREQHQRGRRTGVTWLFLDGAGRCCWLLIRILVCVRVCVYCTCASVCVLTFVCVCVFIGLCSHVYSSLDVCVGVCYSLGKRCAFQFDPSFSHSAPLILVCHLSIPAHGRQKESKHACKHNSRCRRHTDLYISAGMSCVQYLCM